MYISLTEKLAEALLYAADAYHTMGAIRHVVGGMQMTEINRAGFDSPLTIMDLWVSMIENWGEANKEYANCGDLLVGPCLVKMGKYLARMFNAMRLVRARATHITEILDNYDDLGPAFTSLQFLPCGRDCLVAFLRRFGCTTEAENFDETPQPALSLDCLSKINKAVDNYNEWLASLVRAGDGREV